MKDNSNFAIKLYDTRTAKCRQSKGSVLPTKRCLLTCGQIKPFRHELLDTDGTIQKIRQHMRQLIGSQTPWGNHASIGNQAIDCCELLRLPRKRSQAQQITVLFIIYLIL